MSTRRAFLRTSAAGLLGAALAGRAQAVPEAPRSDSAGTQPPLAPKDGRPDPGA